MKRKTNLILSFIISNLLSYINIFHYFKSSWNPTNQPKIELVKNLNKLNILFNLNICSKPEFKNCQKENLEYITSNQNE